MFQFFRNICLLQSPVGNGRVVCFSVYCGPDVDFGNGPMLWVDTMEGEGRVGEHILHVFKEYLEDPEVLSKYILSNIGTADQPSRCRSRKCGTTTALITMFYII